MKINNSVCCILLVSIFAIGCGESKKKEEPVSTETAVETVNEAAMEAAKIAEDSLQRIKIADSIKQDSLKQVKEHGHVH